LERVESSRATHFLIFMQSPLSARPIESATPKTGYDLSKLMMGRVLMKKRVGASPLESPSSKTEKVKVDVETLQREINRLLQALEKLRNDEQRLQKETTRLYTKAKSLNCILAKSRPEPEYLRREE